MNIQVNKKPAAKKPSNPQSDLDGLSRVIVGETALSTKLLTDLDSKNVPSFFAVPMSTSFDIHFRSNQAKYARKWQS
jgi:hypothetical protein